MVKSAHRLLAGCLVILTLCLFAQAQQPSSKDDGASKTPLIVYLAPVDAHSRLIYTTAAQYPEKARQGHIEGPVAVRVVVNSDGVVEKMTPLKGNPFLLMAAMNAIKSWRYRPYVLNGAAVEFESIVTVKFAL
jgi:TonB family protein